MDKCNTIDCKKCGKSIQLEQGMTEGFCLYCGERFNIGQTEYRTDIVSIADKLYENRDWTQLWQIVKDEKDTGKLRVYKILSSFYVNYHKYLDEADELNKKTRSKAYFEAFIGKNSFASDEMHNEFRAFAENCVNELADIQKQNDVAESVGPEACAITMEFLLAKKNIDSILYWPLTACEHFCIPLIPFISLEKLTEIYSEYERINPPSQALPNQRKVKAAIAEEIVNNGGEVPKKRRFGKRG